MGILAAQNIATDVSVNLWEVNTGTEYQEDGKLTRSSDK